MIGFLRGDSESSEVSREVGISGNFFGLQPQVTMVLNAVPTLLHLVVVVVLFTQLCDLKNGRCRWQVQGRGASSPKKYTNLVSVEINSSATIATIDDHFVCATLDWWPPEKCDYGTCAWGNASLLHLNLSSPVFRKALQDLSPLRIRLGGSLQDNVVYDVGTPQVPCRPFVYNTSVMFNFQGGCLSMQRWTELTALFQETGTVVAFGLNALYNRPKLSSGAWGAWDPSNARDFIKYTVDQGIQVQAWQLGNELSGSGVGTSVSALQYAVDVKALRNITDILYASTTQKPLVIAPDGFFDYGWYSAFLKATGPGVIDFITRHIYNLGPGVSTDLVQKILDPQVLDNEANNFASVNNLLQNVAPTTGAWVGESGGAYNSGHHLVTDAFVFSFWYLDQLGMAASFNNKVYCRQSFIGGNYGLLNTTTYEPNPDYYSALLWNRLMGTKVLAVSSKNATYLRAYAHCTRNNTQGGVTVLLINLSNTTTYNVDVSFILTSPTIHYVQKVYSSIWAALLASVPAQRLEYHLTAPGDNLHSQVVLLNGYPLKPSPSGDGPSLSPIQVDKAAPVQVAPLSIAFAVIPDAGLTICNS